MTTSPPPPPSDPTGPGLHLAVALDGAGFHPAAWRHASARPDELFLAPYWTRLARRAERGRLDLLTIEDGLGLQSSLPDGADSRTDQVRGRLDAVQVASLMAAVTSHLGLVPTAVTTHTEPFHLASALATLDYLSRGRAGWRPQVSARRSDAAHVGRRALPDIDLRDRRAPAVRAFVQELFDEATDVVEVVRRLWDSWEDDAVIRDQATGRFVDRDKLHHVDFDGRHFSVKGPSIVPRPPQGQPLVAALAHNRVPFEFAARAADVVFVTPADAGDVARWVGNVRRAEATVERPGPPLVVLADLVVFLDDTRAAAEAAKERLDELDGAPYASDAATFVGTPDELAGELVAWRDQGVRGFRLRPAVLDRDLDAIVDGLVPALQAAGAFRTEYGPGLLRERFGLGRPPSRYAAAPGGGARDAPDAVEVQP